MAAHDLIYLVKSGQVPKSHSWWVPVENKGNKQIPVGIKQPDSHVMKTWVPHHHWMCLKLLTWDNQVYCFPCWLPFCSASSYISIFGHLTQFLAHQSFDLKHSGIFSSVAMAGWLRKCPFGGSSHSVLVVFSTKDCPYQRGICRVQDRTFKVRLDNLTTVDK